MSDRVPRSNIEQLVRNMIMFSFKKTFISTDQDTILALHVYGYYHYNPIEHFDSIRTLAFKSIERIKVFDLYFKYWKDNREPDDFFGIPPYEILSKATEEELLAQYGNGWNDFRSGDGYTYYIQDITWSHLIYEFRNICSTLYDDEEYFQYKINIEEKMKLIELGLYALNLSFPYDDDSFRFDLSYVHKKYQSAFFDFEDEGIIPEFLYRFITNRSMKDFYHLDLNIRIEIRMCKEREFKRAIDKLTKRIHEFDEIIPFFIKQFINSHFFNERELIKDEFYDHGIEDEDVAKLDDDSLKELFKDNEDFETSWHKFTLFKTCAYDNVEIIPELEVTFEFF
jgi:hypothetical protein